MSIPLNVLVGPTASGKSTLALEIARRTGAHILSMDSMAVYRGMDIGTDKPSLAVRQEIPHYLIDVCQPWESFSVGAYLAQARAVIERLHAVGQPLLIVGGTALYLKALVEGVFQGPAADWNLRRQLSQEPVAELYARLQTIDPAAAARIARQDQRRIIRALEVYYLTGKPISAHQQQDGRPDPRYRAIMVGLHWERAQLYQRIEKRVDRMFQKGLVAETRALLEHPQGLSHAPRQALGYRESIALLQGEYDLATAQEITKRNTRRFAKRQLTWLRRFPIRWLNMEEHFGQDRLAEELIAWWHLREAQLRRNTS